MAFHRAANRKHYIDAVGASMRIPQIHLPLLKATKMNNMHLLFTGALQTLHDISCIEMYARAVCMAITCGSAQLAVSKVVTRNALFGDFVFFCDAFNEFLNLTVLM